MEGALNSLGEKRRETAGVAVAWTEIAGFRRAAEKRIGAVERAVR